MVVVLWIAVCVLAAAALVLLSLALFWRGEANRWTAVAYRLIEGRSQAIASGAVPTIPSDPPHVFEPPDSDKDWPL